MASRARTLLRLTLVCASLLLIPATRAQATFHLAHIDEVLTSHNGSSDVQFVEIVMEKTGQQFVGGSKLNAFDAQGNLIGTVLDVPGNVASGANRSWIMGTPAFETASGLQVDFEFPNGSLPAAGGMICWGRPGNMPTPISCPIAGFPYVDCLAYGSYSGPTNDCIGTPNPIAPVGHSLQRVQKGHDNSADFVCADPAAPRNNARESASMPATTPCPQGTTTTTATTNTGAPTTTIGPTTTSIVVSTTVNTTTTVPGATTTTLPPVECGDASRDAVIDAADALLTLRAAVGSGECAPVVCDADGSNSITAADALLILRAAVGLNVTLNCPVE